MATLEVGFPTRQQFGLGVLPLSLPDGMASDMLPDRPSSALARGIRITEFQDSRVNPEPMSFEESDLLLEEYLSPRKLRALTGTDNLEDVHYLEMKVDTRDTSLGNFGSHVPELTRLKLSNSIITCIRDLGSCLNNLKVLWVARCGLEDIDGISSMCSLRELYLAYNEICDISPCSMVDTLQILDLEGNNVEDIEQVGFLSMCQKLTHLTLEGNPVCVTPTPEAEAPDYNYRQAVKRSIPHLQYLDDEQLLETEVDRKCPLYFEDDWKLITDLMEQGHVTVSEEDAGTAAPSVFSRPGTQGFRPATGYRPGSALKPYTAAGLRPGSRSGRLGSSRPGTGVGPLHSSGGRPGSGSGARPGTAGRPLSGEEVDNSADVSELTRGVVVCGNPSKALRARQSGAKHQSKDTSKLFAQLRHRPEHSYDTSLEDDEDMKELLDELKQWKMVHARKASEIEAQKAPQVLTIDYDHDERASVSGGESVDSEEGEGEDGEDPLPPSHPESLADIRSNGDSSEVRPKLYEEAAASRRRRRPLHHDESYDAPEDDAAVTTPEKEDVRLPVPPPTRRAGESGRFSRSVESVRSPSPVLIRPRDDDRPISGPSAVGIRDKFKLSPIVDKHQPKSIDPMNPIIRTSVKSPESRVPEGPRAGTARAALGQPAARIRKGQLANVQLLPSRFPSSK